MGTKKGGPGEVEEGEDSPHLARVPPMFWAGGHRRAARHFPLSPRWASKPLTHSTGVGDGGWGLDKGQPALGPYPVAPQVMGEREERFLCIQE